MKFRLMIGCKEAVRLLSDKLEYPLPLHKKILLKFHISICNACCLYGRQIKGLKNLVSRHSETEKDSSPSSEFSLSNDAYERMNLLLKKKNA